MADSEHPEMRCCDECGSDHFATASQMSRLCSECSHWLYGYSRCIHEFVQGRCSKCDWDGSVSAYIRGLQTQQGEQGLA